MASHTGKEYRNFDDRNDRKGHSDRSHRKRSASRSRSRSSSRDKKRRDRESDERGKFMILQDGK
jgi:hypothetical protein